jgi:hypothetical protein
VNLLTDDAKGSLRTLASALRPECALEVEGMEDYTQHFPLRRIARLSRCPKGSLWYVQRGVRASACLCMER